MELFFVGNVLGAMSYDLDDKQTEEAMSHLADYVDHLPLWHLAGHTAAEYPSEAFVRKLTVREPLGPMVRQLKKEARHLTDILNGKPMPHDQWPQEPEEGPGVIWKVGRNDPCPCGSGLKYKKCHGKNQAF